MKLLEVAPVNPVEVKLIVAPVTAAALVAVSPEKVAVPLTAARPVAPPSVQVPAPTAAATVAVLAVAFPYWSWIATTGWVASAPPLLAGVAGCVVMASLFAAPAPMFCVTVALLYPVAITAMLLLPLDCSNAEAEGVKVILLGAIE